MSEQNWRDLPAGRELDRLVAERMGYEVIDYARDVVGVDDDQPNPVFKPESDEHALMQVMKPVPHYSTSVDAALALVPGGDIAFELYRDENTGDWWAEFDGWYDEGSPWPALAIVRAWLLWKDGTA